MWPEHSPVLSTDRGDLFVPDQIPAAAVRLRIPPMSYIQYIDSLQSEERPDIFRIVVVDDLPFQVVINGVVAVSNRSMENKRRFRNSLRSIDDVASMMARRHNLTDLLFCHFRY
jgi:hypothetical protein